MWIRLTVTFKISFWKSRVGVFNSDFAGLWLVSSVNKNLTYKLCKTTRGTMLSQCSVLSVAKTPLHVASTLVSTWPSMLSTSTEVSFVRASIRVRREGILLWWQRTVSYLALTLPSVSVSGAIAERIPNSITMKNQIPKSYLHYDLYCNLIPNEDENAPYFQQVPRTWAFEVSYKGMVSIHSCFCNARFLLYLLIVDLL